MLTDKRPVRLILTILIAGILIACVVSVCVKISWDVNGVKTYDLGDDWHIESGGNVYDGVSLSEVTGAAAFDRGDMIIMSTVIPEDFPSHPGMQLDSMSFTIEVKIDRDTIYRYGQERFARGYMIGGGSHFIQIPARSAGKTLTIYMTAGERMHSPYVPGIVVTDSIGISKSFLSGKTIDIFVDFFLFILGIVIFVISLAFIKVSKTYIELSAAGLLSLNLSIWNIANDNLLLLFEMGNTANSIIRYASFYFLPITMMFLVKSVSREISKDSRTKLNIITLMSVAFFAAALIFQIFNVIHFPRLLPVFHILLLMVVLLSIFITHRPFSEREVPDKIFVVAFYIMAAFGVLDLLFYYINIFLATSQFGSRSHISFGNIIFLSGALASFLINRYKSALDEEEVKALEDLAYVDSLTGLGNRTRANELISMLNDGEEPFMFFSCDINELKKANDSFGHESGDRLIVTIAEIMKECFSSFAEVLRMGGDEFTVLVKKDDFGKLSAAVRKMVQMENEASAKEPFNVEVSFGAAASTEFETPKAEDVLRLSDQRMYEMKERFGRGRKL